MSGSGAVPSGRAGSGRCPPRTHEVRWGVLGGVRVAADGVPVDLSPRSRYVLGMLLAEPGQPVPGERLLNGARSTASQPAASAPRAAVSRLRAALAPVGAAGAVVTAPGGYVLDVEPAAVDHVAFRRTVRDAEATEWPADALRTLETALAMWAGDPFGDLADEPALRQRAQALEEAHRSAVDTWCGLAVEAGATARAIAGLEAAVCDDPFRERRWGALMVAHYRAGDQRRAIQTYDRARDLLTEQVGIEPGPELRDLLRAVLDQDPDLDWRPERNQRRPVGSTASAPTALVGRETELADVADLVDRNRVVVLTGFAGVGKTALATEAATRAPGVAWIARVRAGRPARPLHDVAASMGLAVHEPDLFARVAAALQDAAGLLVIDGCEVDVAAVSSLITDLRAAAPAARLLATSRVELDVGGAFTMVVAPLPTGTPERPGPAAVLAADAALVRPSRIEADWSTIAAICSRADGLPLAIGLLGAAFADGAGPALDGVGDLSSAAGAALDSLPAESRHVVDLLGALSGEVGVAFLGALTGIGAPAVQRSLGPAVRAGLVVQRTEPGAGARARLLEQVREAIEPVPYLTGVLVKDLHRSFGELAEASSPSPIGAIDVERAAAVDDEHELALWLLAQLGAEDRLELACRLVPVWRACSRHVDGRRVLEELEAVAASASPPAGARYWVRRAQMSPSLADRVPLIDRLRWAMAVAEEDGDPELAARAGSELAVGLGWSGRGTEAAALIAELRRRVPADNEWAHVTLRTLEAMGRGLARDPAGAATELVELARDYGRVGHGGEVASNLYVASGMARLAGDDDLLDRVLDEAAAVPVDRFSAYPWAGLALERARVAAATGDASAGPLMWEAFGLFQRHGEQRTAAICRRDLGSWRLRQGDRRGVRDLAVAARTLLRADARAAAVAVARIVAAAPDGLGADETMLLSSSIPALAAATGGVPLDAGELAEVASHPGPGAGPVDTERLDAVLRELADAPGADGCAPPPKRTFGRIGANGAMVTCR